ncbi:MAG: hypothetical protein EPN72_08730 [Nevskiaceae bacterium]|nr:MAG: hypothetical protein EPN63_08070 [Nevskiaceae bacterium]TBR72527.1 MAG: hypothetical protein EPN72_08730 [Nevskiaceae bacterium]
MKTRQEGRTVSADGRREALGVDVGTSEAEALVHLLGRTRHEASDRRQPQQYQNDSFQGARSSLATVLRDFVVHNALLPRDFLLGFVRFSRLSRHVC